MSKVKTRTAKAEQASTLFSPQSAYALVSKAITQVQAGDLVASRNEQSGEVNLKRVLRTSVREVKLTLTVTLSNPQTGNVVETLTTTREHPFYVEDKGFVSAGGLAVGNQVVTRAGLPLVVSKLKWQRHAKGMPVYNFEVEDDHTYFVGSAHGGIWVHNPKWCPDTDLIEAPIKNKYPSWQTVQRRYWQKHTGSREPPKHPTIIDPRTGTGIAKELHHRNGREIPNPHQESNLIEVWPWEHADIDSDRRYTGPRP